MPPLTKCVTASGQAALGISNTLDGELRKEMIHMLTIFS